MKKKIVQILIMICLLPLATNAFSAGDKPDKKENISAPLWETRTKLTQEQENALYVMTTEYLRERQPIQRDLAQKQAEYNALMRHAEPNVKLAGELAAEISTFEYTLMNMSMRYHNQIAKNFNIPMSNCSNGGCPDHKIKRGTAH